MGGGGGSFYQQICDERVGWEFPQNGGEESGLRESPENSLFRFRNSQKLARISIRWEKLTGGSLEEYDSYVMSSLQINYKGAVSLPQQNVWCFFSFRLSNLSNFQKGMWGTLPPILMNFALDYGGKPWVVFCLCFLFVFFGHPMVSFAVIAWVPHSAVLMSQARLWPPRLHRARARQQFQKKKIIRRFGYRSTGSSFMKWPVFGLWSNFLKTKTVDLSKTLTGETQVDDVAYFPTQQRDNAVRYAKPQCMSMLEFMDSKYDMIRDYILKIESWYTWDSKNCAWFASLWSKRLNPRLALLEPTKTVLCRLPRPPKGFFLSTALHSVGIVWISCLHTRSSQWMSRVWTCAAMVRLLWSRCVHLMVKFLSLTLLHLDKMPST